MPGLSTVQKVELAAELRYLAPIRPLATVGYRHLAELVIAIARHALRAATEHQPISDTYTDTTVTDTHTATTEKAFGTLTV
jgi:hypothetical protein